MSSAAGTLTGRSFENMEVLMRRRRRSSRYLAGFLAIAAVVAGSYTLHRLRATHIAVVGARPQFIKAAAFRNAPFI